MTIYVDASCDIHYSSYYIHGLYEIYGKKNVRFSSKYFMNFEHNNHFLAFVYCDADVEKKIIIDFTDSRLIDEKALKWCDAYGKINLDSSFEKNEKIIPIGPSFGIQIYSFLETVIIAISNFIKARNRIKNVRRFFADYKSQYLRPKLSDYKHKRSFGNRVFFMASLWKKESETNWYRANFIKVCRTLQDIDFEGGFAPRTRDDIRGFEDLTTSSRISMRTYLQKTIDSAVVFNTPAVKSCHGWKLAEYLCMGKAILTTVLTREMPIPFEHEKQVVYTTGENEDISEKLRLIIGSDDLRQQLESGSQAYYHAHLTPKIVINKIMDRFGR